MNAGAGALLIAIALGAALGALPVWLLLRQAQRAQRLQLASAEERLRATFAESAASALTSNTDLFLKIARETFAREQTEAAGSLAAREAAIGQLLDPIRRALERTEQQVGALEKERREAFGSLKAQIEAMTAGQNALQRETRNLVGALRRPEVRGRWGELTLRRVVELAGMSSHCDFTEQLTIDAGAAGRMRPDMIVHMPDGRDLVIDAKTPLDAYLEAIEAPTEEARSAALARHAQQLEARVRELGTKAYWRQFATSPDFVVLFLPGDQFLGAALAERPDLLENALRLSVIVATPSTLVALLKAVYYGWRQAQLAENAAQIRGLGEELHRRLVVFATHLQTLGRRLGQTVETYNGAIGSLESQLMPNARRLGELGAAGGEALPTLEPVDKVTRLPTIGTGGGAA